MSRIRTINDPVHGIIDIPNEIITELLNEPIFQRLRRISQTGLLSMVFPSATHTRLHHVLGCMYLMNNTLQSLKSKGISISQEEQEAALSAIFLHDIGHGPYSHALEFTLVDVAHEEISVKYINFFNEKMGGKLDLALKMFRGTYERKFFHQLISSQMDLDRLDYLKRDSFYTNVAEGSVNVERLISMFNVVDNELVFDFKGIYSIENFLISRMQMYWQAYFHKITVSSEIMMKKLLKRAKKLALNGEIFNISADLQYFLSRAENSELSEGDLHRFSRLDDVDILSATKVWSGHKDSILSKISQMILNRELLISTISNEKFSDEYIHSLTLQTQREMGEEATHFIATKTLQVEPYRTDKEPIKLLQKNGNIVRLEKCTSQIFANSLHGKITRYFLCSPLKFKG